MHYTYVATTIYTCYSVTVCYECCYYINPLLLQYGNTALHWACCYGHTEIVKYLITKNANISVANNVSDCV